MLENLDAKEWQDLQTYYSQCHDMESASQERFSSSSAQDQVET